MNRPALRRGGALAVLGGLAVLPLVVGGRHGFGLGTTAVIAVITALGLQVTYGFSGQLSVAQAPLQGVGAYAVANLMTTNGWSFWAALPVAVLVAAAFGVVVGLPGWRVQGDVLALVTLGAGEILQSLYLNTERFTGGFQGIAGVPGVSVGGTVLDYRALYGVALALGALSLAAVLAMRASPLGRAWLALRDDEVAARALGVHVGRLRLLAFSVGAALAGAAGGLFAVKNGFVSSVSFGLAQSVVVILVVLLAGEGQVGRTVVAAVAVTFLFDQLSAYGDISEAVTGIVILALVAARVGVVAAARDRVAAVLRPPAWRLPAPSGDR